MFSRHSWTVLSQSPIYLITARGQMTSRMAGKTRAPCSNTNLCRTPSPSFHPTWKSVDCKMSDLLFIRLFKLFIREHVWAYINSPEWHYTDFFVHMSIVFFNLQQFGEFNKIRTSVLHLAWLLNWAFFSGYRETKVHIYSYIALDFFKTSFIILACNYFYFILWRTCKLTGASLYIIKIR